MKLVKTLAIVADMFPQCLRAYTLDCGFIHVPISP